MRVAVSNIAWRADQEDVAKALLVELGIGGVEIAPTMIWPRPTEVAATDLEDYRRTWNDLGIEIVAAQALLFGQPHLRLFDAESVRAETLRYLSRIVRLSAALGARALVFGSPGNRLRGDVPEAQAVEIATRFFRELGEVAHDHGTAVCIEGNAPAYGCDFLRTTSEARALVQQVDHPGVRLQLDTSTMALNGEDFAAEIVAGVPVAGHFHASEPHLSAVRRGGAVDHASAARALKRAGYEGWVSMEMRAHPAAPDLALVREALETVRECYGSDR